MKKIEHRRLDGLAKSAQRAILETEVDVARVIK
jgi:hypothetical protein